MGDMLDRRIFLKSAAAAGAAIGVGTMPKSGLLAAQENDPLFKISLAEWSFHRTINDKKTMTNLDFPIVAKRDFGIDAVEYVNQFFKDKARDTAYLTDLKKRCDDNEVRSVLIMIDGEGELGHADEAKRREAVENHHKWVEAAKFLGCHSIRVNAHSSGSYDEQMGRAADGLRQLSEFADPYSINVIVENHGGLSSNGAWLAGTIKKVGLPNCGTLPDFGNFRVSNDEEYDRYKGVDELMPFAKAVSAKSHDFNEAGDETHTDYFKILDIVVKKHGYHGYCGIEYEGSKLSEADGIKATKKLLERVREKLSG